jgi:type IV pilus assembly protein PilB
VRFKPARGARDPKANGTDASEASDVVTGVADREPPSPQPVKRESNGRAKAVAKRDLSRPRLGDVLVDHELANTEQVEHALAQQAERGKRLGDVVVDTGVVDDHNLTETLARQLGLEIVDLRKVRPEPDAVAQLPESVARLLNAVPVRIRDKVLEVVVWDPSRDGIGKELADAVNGPVRLLLAPQSEVTRTLDQSYRALAGVARHVREFELTNTSTRATEQSSSLQQAVEPSAPVVQVVNLMVTQASRDRASDVHIEPMDDQVRVRMRIDGALTDSLTLPAEMGPAIVSRIKVMSE